MNSAFIPIFNSLTSKAEKNDFLNFVFFSFLVILTLLTALVYFLGADLLSDFFFILDPKENSDFLKQRTSFLIKLLFPYIVFISLTSICHGALNSFHQFKVTAFAPIMFNVVIIVGVLFILVGIIANEDFTTLLAYFILLAGVVNLLHALFYLFKLRFRLRIPNFFQRKEFFAFYRLMLPVLLSSGIYQLNIFLIDPIAVSLSVGSVAILFYCNRLLELPLGIFGVSITTASMPTLARLFKRHDFLKMKHLILRSINLVFLLFVPVIVIFFHYHLEIISIIFEWGFFAEKQIQETSRVFYYYIFSLLPIPIYRILLNAFYAFQNAKVPLYATFFALIVNLSLALSLAYFIQQTYVIALASAITSYFLLFYLMFYLRKKLKLNFFHETMIFFFKWSGIVAIPWAISFSFKTLMQPFWTVLNQQATNFWVAKIIKLAELSVFSAFFVGLFGLSLLVFQEKETLILFKKN